MQTHTYTRARAHKGNVARANEIRVCAWRNDGVQGRWEYVAHSAQNNRNTRLAPTGKQQR